jgi:hypothetical protein
VTPIDLGMEWIVAKGKDFIGRRSLLRSDTARQDRKQLVGLLTERPHDVLPEGGQIFPDAPVSVPARAHGHVTSSYFSACLDRSIALALVVNGRERMGEIVRVLLDDRRMMRARIVKPVFIDPEGARQNAELGSRTTAPWSASAHSSAISMFAAIRLKRPSHGPLHSLLASICRPFPTPSTRRVTGPCAGCAPMSG